MTRDAAREAARAFADATIDAAVAESHQKWFALLVENHFEQRARYLTPAAAAEYLGVSRKRIYDLTSARVLVPDGRDGRTPLFLRSTLDAYVAGVMPSLPARV